ncbi:hypothetical protein AAON49_04160 [Pseudotenacibaculum sp. MALMAid0570]|uniref:hypothetical protein n=1 Tax=Pseudotenacibaculum sp. MALMAid0570 TaxID=3143938 RepID=UPI0032DFC2DD
MGNSNLTPPSISAEALQALKNHPAAQNVIENFVKNGLSNPAVQQAIKNHDISQYKNANGQVTCPVSQADRDALKSKLSL